MERGREGRRSGGPVSAPRRPRTTGFKDSPVREDEEVAEEAHNSRLRERGKKEKESLSSGSGLRNKRKRQEVQPAADEADDSTDETDAAGSDDDDDAPPPIPRWSGKGRPGKFAEESIGLDLPAVPRKARSAIVKRHHEASQPPSHAATPPQQHSSPSAPAPSGHNNNNNGNGSNTPSSSAAAANKPGRRLKPNGSKTRPAKIPKSSPAPISEQEVEVAEALFDLSRMAPSQAKPDSRAENAQALSPPAASPISGAPAGSHSAEAPRRKRPRIRPREEPAARPVTTVPSGNVPQRLEHDRNSSVERTMVKLEATAKPSTASLQPASATGQEHASELHDAKPEAAAPDMATERRGEAPAISAMDSTKRKLDARPVKFEIDLMAPPSGSMGNDGLDCSTDVHPQHQELPWAEKERERLKEKDGKDKEEKFVKTEKLDLAERECLDLNKHGMGSQRMTKSSRVDAKTQKPDSVSAAVVSAASSFLNASTTSSSTTPSPMSMTSWPGALPSVGYYGHAAAAVAAAAAAGGWPQTAASTGSLGGAEENNASHPQVIPYLSGRHSWKRCAIHVFIARFIDVQQQMARHSLMAATYTAYGGKPYNLNVPAEGVMSGASSDLTTIGVPLGGERSLFSNGQGQKSSSFVDALYRKHPVQQQQQSQQLQPQQPQPQLQPVQGPSPAFGFPVGTSSGSNAAGSTGASAGTSASSVPAGPSNNNAASMAAQAQLFQAVLQHNPFSFPFPASHFGNHSFNGGQNIGQQAAQFVNNPFYASHLVHPAQSQQQGQPAGVLSGTSQKSQSHGGGRVLPSIGQQQFPSQQGLAGGALQSEKEGGSNREVAADNKLQRLVFGQQGTNSGAPNLNMLQDGCQDYSALPGKLVSKPPVLQQQASAGVLPSTTATGQHGGTSTLQMSIKNLDSQSSQVSTSVGTTRSSVGPGPLGLSPVAPVMAPQGHVVLQGMADQANQARLQTHLHSLQSGQQRSLQQQQPQKMPGDDMEGNKSYHDDRKLSTKRVPRVDLEALPSMQGSPTSSSSRMGSNGAAANLLPTGPQAVSSRLNVPSPQAAPSLQPCSQSVKQGGVGRTKSPAPPFVDRAGGASRQAMSFPSSKNGQGQQISHPAQLKLSQRPGAAPAVGGPALLGSSMGKNHQRMPSGNPGPSPPSSMPLAQGPKPGSTPQKNAVAKGTPLTLSQKPTATAAVAAATSGKRSPAGMSPSSSGGQNHQSATRNVAQQHQQQQVSSPQQQASSPQQQFSAHSVNQQQQQQTVNHLQPKSFPQMRQLQYLPQQQQGLHPQQTPAMSPSGNGGLSLSSSTPQGPSLASNSNGTRDNMSSSGSSTNSRPGSASSPATSGGTQRGANSTGMPLLHQTGSPGCHQQTSNVPVSGYPNGGGPTVKSSASEQKMESETLSGGIRSPSSPMKTPNMTLGRQQQQHLLPGAAARVSAQSSSSGAEVRVNIMTPTGAAQQQQPQPPAAQPAPAATSAHLVPIAVAASGGSPGLLGQSSASALRP